MDQPIPSPPPVTFPSYKNPPVNEVVCGMRFETPDNLRIPHIGILWDRFRTVYPNIQHAPPIATAKGGIPIDQAAGLPLPRIWFINESDDQLVQFQIDRFYFNWRRRKEEYPRYGHVIDRFESIRSTIESFFREFGLGELRPVEYELSYVNHIPMGQGWNSIDDLPKIFSDLLWKRTATRFLPNPTNIAWQVQYSLPEKGGHLFVDLKQAIRTEDKVSVLVLDLTARGISESAGKSAREWFNMAHEWIVRGFTDLTTPDVQKLWERES